MPRSPIYNMSFAIGLEHRKRLKSHLTQFHLHPLLFLFLLQVSKTHDLHPEATFSQNYTPFLSYAWMPCEHSSFLPSPFILSYYYTRVPQCEFVKKISQGIPQIFLREYGNSLSNFVFLHLPTGAEWRVELSKRRGEVLFSSGWQRFADFYSIGYGHFLLFRYEGSSHFHVLIFDMTTSEIEYPYATAPTHDHNHLQVSVEILGDFPSSKTTNQTDMIDITSSEAMFHPNGGSSLPKVERGFPTTHKTSKTTRNNPSFKPHNACSSHHYHSSIPNIRDGALGRAKAFKSENHFFIVTMRPSYVGSRYNLTLPRRFFKRHFKTDNNNTILSVSDGRTWTVKYIMGKANVRFSSGWTKFARDNSLEVGDVCAFELIKCTRTSLKVIIFRNNEVASHDLQQ